MKKARMTLDEIRRVGLEALDNALGPVSTIRFLQQFELGHGDYTADREQWLEKTSVAEIHDSIVKGRDQSPKR